MNNDTNNLEQVIISLTLENTNLKAKLEQQNHISQIYFHEYVEKWLLSHENRVRKNSFLAYQSQVNKHIIPYFRVRNFLLKDITCEVLEEYYKYKMENDNLSASTVGRHHSNIQGALKMAIRNNLIDKNPADYVFKPKVTKYKSRYLDATELTKIILLFKNHRMYIPILLAATLGLRRSEVLGLKWKAIDFEKQIICINHTVVKLLINNKYEISCNDLTKSDTSNRLISIPEQLSIELQKWKNIQTQNYNKYLSGYNKRYLDYVCTDEFGKLFTPDNLSNRFKTVVENYGYKLRFHDLRHSTASILANEGIQMKDISEWLGHSSINITSNIYVHLFEEKKNHISSKINELIKLT